MTGGPVLAAAETTIELDEPVIAEGLTATEWGLAAGVFVGAIVVGRIAGIVLARHFRADEEEAFAGLTLARMVRTAVAVAGLVYALVILEVRIGPLLGALGIGGLALAIASQSLLGDLLSSVILQARHPFRRGDQIGTNDIEGTVEDVNFRTVVLRTYDGTRVHVPASAVLASPITNFTARGMRRTTLVVGLAYDTDLSAAREVLLGAVRGVAEVRDRPGPEAWVERFNDSTIDVALRFWHAPQQQALWRVRNDVAIAVKAALDGAGMVIAFPQRTLWWAGPSDSEFDSDSDSGGGSGRPQ